VWEDKKHGGELHLHLRRKGRKYRKRGANENTNGLIGNISPKDAHSKTLLTNKLNMFNTS
jgi:IS30 family transposase